MSTATPDRARPLRADAADNERAVLDAAATLLARDPQTSTEDIATAAGVNRATVYRRFPSRADLVTALRRRAALDSHAALTDARPEEDTAVDALDRVIIALAGIALRYQALFLDGLTGEHPTEEYTAIRTELIALFSRGQEEGALTDAAPPEWLVSVLSAHLGALARATRRGVPAVADPLLMFRTTLLDGIGRSTSPGG